MSLTLTLIVALTLTLTLILALAPVLGGTAIARATADTPREVKPSKAASTSAGLIN